MASKKTRGKRAKAVTTEQRDIVSAVVLFKWGMSMAEVGKVLRRSEVFVSNAVRRWMNATGK